MVAPECSFETTFRNLQNKVFQEYIALLGCKLTECFAEAQLQYPWQLSNETIRTEKVEDPVPSHAQIQMLQRQTTKYTLQMQDDMTANLSSLTLFLKSTAASQEQRQNSASLSTEQEQQEFTDTVTSLLICAAVDTFKKVSGPFTPSYILILSRLLTLEERGEEAMQLWLWSKIAASHLASLEVQMWVTFALEKIDVHQHTILAFVDKIGNLATKRTREE